MKTTNAETRLIVFAKAPEPGAVKTRLIPLLGEAGAAALQARLVERTLTTACAAGVGPVELCCAPRAENPFFESCGGRHAVSLVSQTEGDLGARMLNAFARALSVARHVILIGTDCPALTVSHLRPGRTRAGRGNDAVLVPAEDGGYVLLGLNRCDAALFHDIEWGSAKVMTATRERLRRLRWRWKELETLWDIDRPEDYRRLLASGLLDTGERASAD